MSFADEMGKPCGDCLRILRRDGVAESCDADRCHQCPYGVRIENGKRVLSDNNASKAQQESD